MNLFVLLFQDGGGLLSMLPMMLIIFGIFYFLVIMPQRRQQRELQALISELKAGDEVVTNGGVIGKIIEVRDTSFIIRSADKSNMEIARTAVVGKRGENQVK
jgi:preprotein translocase subunit YajC